MLIDLVNFCMFEVQHCLTMVETSHEIYLFIYHQLTNTFLYLQSKIACPAVATPPISIASATLDDKKGFVFLSKMQLVFFGICFLWRVYVVFESKKERKNERCEGILAIFSKKF